MLPSRARKNRATRYGETTDKEKHRGNAASCLGKGPNTMGHVAVLKDYRLTTAEIVYHLPDHPALLQTYVWQSLDIAPDFPELRKFLAFWRKELDGELHSVRVAANPLARAGQVRHATTVHTLH